MVTAILAGAFLAGPQAMDVVGLEDYQDRFEPEADALLLSAAAFREALGTEREIEPEGLRSVDIFRDSFRYHTGKKDIDGFHKSWVAFAVLVRGLPQESRTRAAERVRHAMSFLFAANAKASEGGSPVRLIDALVEGSVAEFSSNQLLLLNQLTLLAFDDCLPSIFRMEDIRRLWQISKDEKTLPFTRSRLSDILHVLYRKVPGLFAVEIRAEIERGFLRGGGVIH